MNIIIIDAKSIGRRFSKKRIENTKAGNKEMGKFRFRKTPRSPQGLGHFAAIPLNPLGQTSFKHRIFGTARGANPQRNHLLPLPQVQVHPGVTEVDGRIAIRTL